MGSAARQTRRHGPALARVRELRSIQKFRTPRRTLRATGEGPMSRKLTYDSWLFGAAMIIVVLGIVMIYSASAIIATQRFGAENSYHFMTRQLVWLFAGGALMMLLMHVDLALMQDRRVQYVGMALIGLALVVALFQAPINGTHRWIVTPWFNVQPSEFAKPILIVFAATF